MSNYCLNTFPFKIIQDRVTLAFSSKVTVDAMKIGLGSLPSEVSPEFKQIITLNNPQVAWWKIDASEAEEVEELVEIDLIKNFNFAKLYFNKIIFNYFQSTDLLTKANFVKDTEVWILEKKNALSGFDSYKKFTIKVEVSRLWRETHVVLSYDGISHLASRPLKDSPIDETIITDVAFDGQIKRYKDLSPEELLKKELIFPKLNFPIRKKLTLGFAAKKVFNSYKEYFEEIKKFYSEYLQNRVVHEKIKFTSTTPLSIDERWINRTSDDSNLLVFGGAKTHFSPFYGLKENGPFSLPTNKKIKFIFVFHEEDKDYANTIFSYFKKGYKSFPGLEPFAGIPVLVDAQNSIQFKNSDNPLPEVEAALKIKKLDAQTQYVAIYISQIKKDGADEDLDIIYYKMKEVLLTYHLVSQVIYKNNIDNSAFNYFLPNIAIAILAKLGGVPWRLHRPIKKDLIIGVGAYKPRMRNQKYMGNSFCFENDGKFFGFDAFENDDAVALSESIRQSIVAYVKQYEKAERLVIHFYKDVNRAEESTIRKTLESLSFDIPCVIVTVYETESKDYVFFDSSYEGLMPQSGTYVNIDRGTYLLCNNTRYAQATGTKVDGFPFPIKLKIRMLDRNESVADVKEIIDQVYQFSRMYWKSVKQKNKPVTIVYSELVAEFFAHFQRKTFNEFSKKAVWFL